jgi:hypothetical protein
MKTLRSFGLVLAVGASLLAVAPGARADKDPCIAAYEQTQTLRKDFKLVEAKAQAELCAKESCPALLAKDCSRWLGDIEASTPSIVLEARTEKGADRVDVKVKVDGAPLVERIDGKAAQIDPGAHVLRFEPEGGEPFEQSIVVHEGEKNRRVKVTIPGPAPPGKKGPRPVPLGAWIFGGASVFALATSAVFAIDGLGKKSDLDACKPSCSPDDVDAMSARFTMADVALGAGVMAGAAAVWLYVTRPAASGEAPGRSRTAASARPYATPVAGGAAVGLGGRF